RGRLAGPGCGGAAGAVPAVSAGDEAPEDAAAVPGARRADVPAPASSVRRSARVVSAFVRRGARLFLRMRAP
ncbi:hypothetical protein ACWEL8_35945, partial [Streptomyces sp. NPDC004690]